MGAAEGDEAPMDRVDVLVAGLGPGGCAAALAARAQGLSTLAVEAHGPQATRSQLVLVRPGAQAALRQLGLPDVTEGRRTTTIRHVETRLRAALRSVLDDDGLDQTRTALLLAGMEVLPVGVYQRIVDMETEAAALGFVEIA